MPLREKDYLRRPDKYFHKIYNAGKADIGSMEKVHDEFGTPIGSSEFVSQMKMWYRNLGVTASDVFYAQSDGTDIEKKIALRGYLDISTKWHVKMKNPKGVEKTYAIYRVYYNPKDDETELNLVGVDY